MAYVPTFKQNLLGRRQFKKDGACYNDSDARQYAIL